MADILTADEERIDAPVMGGGVPSALAAMATKAYRGTQYEEMLTGAARRVVKGVGQVSLGGDRGSTGRPLSDAEHGTEIMRRSHETIVKSRAASYAGAWDTENVLAGISPEFWSHRQVQARYPALYHQAVEASAARKSWAATVGKNFTATNTGATGTPYGLVPYDLLAPSRLIYPIYTLFRNKLPRPAGQGASRQVRGIVGVSGSQTGGQGIINIGIPELVESGGSLSNTNWPLNLPPSGKQTQYYLNIPYRFFGLSESLSWLAQFMGQGFEDVSALANLILLQEFMLGEEYMLIAGSSQNLPTPAAPTLTARTAGSNETAISTSSGTCYVRVTALNYFGESLASSTASVAFTESVSVIDVTVSPVLGAQQYNIYASVTSGSNNQYIQAGTTVQSGTAYAGAQTANAVGGVRFTIQGALATSSNQAYPTADTGTGSSSNLEGLIPTLTGLSASGAGPYSNALFEAGASNAWQGGYVNQSVGTHLSTNAIFTALDGMWESSGLNNFSPGKFRADPSEIVADGGDLMRLANDMITQGAGLNYLLNISQDQIGGIRAGAAVAEFVNPVTRSTVKLTVHPFFAQGTALLMSYQLPQTWSHVDNAWEVPCVQDYVSVAWPVIDATFRYSLFSLETLVAHSPFHSGFLGGLQVSDTTPYS